MARKDYTPEQAIGMLREAEVRLSQGEKIGKICRVSLPKTLSTLCGLADLVCSLKRYQSVSHSPAAVKRLGLWGQLQG
jgi:hypothetical protein